ncbi:FKBP-type peptidyl-prolyl cis-trans isomerase [Halopseudomonas laoshanensis]|uniref:Peptidyl-prolyl cis-trans isomerase n=3 Tax=Gammaproteobacteria TaxID=1236 RepID=A0A7V7GU24_9GAMM|nr:MULTISPECIES: FKBP-type peptidyl-prolyl cis-trans isomerase [Halopseudomonas]KAA0694949.1 FKBP-type peptidyl-prolyl cis-trans isomerase [Halopseudomonas laoshanensis]PCD00813.1 peptidylprolyl isomerase [Halopseudomonas pelagia]QFY58103.1 FKBP-type peptidyl-prolyl cis-trans isomerase [Halopseudomonas pelagia]
MSNTFDTDEQRVSYGIGRQMGDQLGSSNIPDLSIDLVVAGLRDAFTQQPSQVDEAALQQAFAGLQAKMQAAAEATAREAGQAGVEFLIKNAEREGVITLDSGLQYEVVNEGTGATPQASSTVQTHYEGTLITGEVFDSSYKRGQPAEFPVGGVIAGWTEALQLMQEGAKWRLYIPSDLAYGARAAGSIPPHSTLVFDIELLKVL